MTRGPTADSSTFEGFRSRCATLAAWIAVRAAAMPTAAEPRTRRGRPCRQLPLDGDRPTLGDRAKRRPRAGRPCSSRLPRTRAATRAPRVPPTASTTPSCPSPPRPAPTPIPSPVPPSPSCAVRRPGCGGPSRPGGVPPGRPPTGRRGRHRCRSADSVPHDVGEPGDHHPAIRPRGAPVRRRPAGGRLTPCRSGVWLPRAA